MGRRPAGLLALAALWLVPSVAHAQQPGWSDQRARALIQRAIDRRSRQFADSALHDYAARAHGYLAFLGQFGEGFTEPPRAAKVDELVVEVLWRAPDLSKQRLIGRRDTLLLPADIDYYHSRFGIIQNNFPNLIRMGDGRDVRDVPHPLSPTGLELYDFAITDSLSLRLPDRTIDVYAVRIRPREGSEPRVIGTAYIDRGSAAVARLTFTFTRRALLDTRIETLSVVLENALVEARYWLPARQEVEVVRRVRWLDFPARGIIRARWTVCCYELNAGLDRRLFLGPEIVGAPAPADDFSWTGDILDSLPPDVALLTDDDTRRVLAQAREVAGASAIDQLRGGAFSARRISDFVRFNRVEGLALGAGAVLRFGGGTQLASSGRVGLADKSLKGRIALERRPVRGPMLSLYAARGFREVGDEFETSLARNSLAASLFGDDNTDPYEVRAVGVSADIEVNPRLHVRFGASYEWQHRLQVNTAPLAGRYAPTIPAWPLRGARASLTLISPGSAGPWGSRIAWRAEFRGGLSEGWDTTLTAQPLQFGRIYFHGSLHRSLGSHQLVLETRAAAVTAAGVPPQELVLFGGVTTGPGYRFHEFAGKVAVSQRVEWRIPMPFVSIPLGRYGSTPTVATLAPFTHLVYTSGPPPFTAARSGLYPSVGLGLEILFDLLRIQVARGLRGGRWTFSADVTHQLWSIL